MKASYKNVDRTFELHYRSLWDWALDLLNDEHLAPHFEWDARKVFKFNGEEWVRFFNEPWTGNRWWDVQVRNNSKCSFHFQSSSDPSVLGKHCEKGPNWEAVLLRSVCG